MGTKKTSYSPNPGAVKQITPVYGTKQGTKITIPDTYNEQVSYDKGWFQKALLTATKFLEQDVVPILYARYNPKIDDGHGNMIYLKHITQSNYAPPSTDKTVLLQDKPLWQLFFGYLSYCQKVKPHENILKDYIVVIISPAIYPFANQPVVMIDDNFVKGKAPYLQELDALMLKLWFPTVEHQQMTINTFVESGPFIPKYARDRESSWDLHGKYSFILSGEVKTQTQEQIINLIQQQQEQQQQLKHNLLYLIEDLKQQQTKIKIKTGLLH